MPRARPRPAPDCLHGATCECYKVTTGTEQTLEELDFARSACAAAQAGDMARLTKVLDRQPQQVQGTGVQYNTLLQWRISPCVHQLSGLRTPGARGHCHGCVFPKHAANTVLAALDTMDLVAAECPSPVVDLPSSRPC